MHYRIGIDAGSKTIKLVILDEQDKLVFCLYQLHKANILQTTAQMLHDAIWRFGDIAAPICITGSAGQRLAHELGLPHIQEVIAGKQALQF